MAIEYMSFEDVLSELQIDEEELKKLVSQGELRGFRDGLSMKFKRDDVVALKQGRETEPTIILTDSDQEMGIAESSDELILEDSTSDTVINIGDIMGGMKSEQQEIVFDTTEEFSVSPADSDPESAIPTVEVPSVSEDLGFVETDSDAALVEVGSDEAMETEAFELMEDSGEGEGEGEGMETEVPTRARSRRVSSSTRMRALEIQQRKSHAGWTAALLVVVLMPLFLGGAVLYNDLNDAEPQWVLSLSESLRGMVDSMYTWFN